MQAKIDEKKRKKMVAIIKNLEKRMGELEKMRKELSKSGRQGAERTKTLIEEIHVPALEALKERKAVH
ncbi:MAG TPA: hypothetical protein HA222_00035 [Candidatus Diapherotrites archaeon]|uniref:Uncharacterized protein n=1 Tax=Candidatus Iainarchaeum sp. TaxID=3101447 RepID=A0A7J4JYV7_9ARCH|nr:hypothetical protein [Candidatus Diapherotrites archaeon]HIH32876.1 hypothetical protein [Candidatus Diapherotrites archaeon]